MAHLIDLFISPAYADSVAPAAANNGGSPISLTIMFTVFFLFFYFLMWRPQNRRAKEHRELIGSLAKGDEVVTSGGILGKINKVTEQYVTLAIQDSTEIMVQKSAIANVLPKGTIKSLE